MDDDVSGMYGLAGGPVAPAAEPKEILVELAATNGRANLIRLGESTLQVPDLQYFRRLEKTVTGLQGSLGKLTAQVRRIVESHNKIVGEINTLRAEMDNKIDRHD